MKGICSGGRGKRERERLQIKRVIKSTNKLQINFVISNEGMKPPPTNCKWMNKLLNEEVIGHEKGAL